MSAAEPLVLGIETSCDETGIGIVRGRTLLSNTIASSMDEHARYGGVVPEVAARAHLEALQPTIEAALAARAHGRWVQLPGAVWAYVREGAVVLYPEPVVESACARPRSLSVPGAVDLPGARIYAQRVDPVGTDPIPRRADTAVVAVPDGRTLGLRVRTPRPGERFRPAGARRQWEILAFLKQRGVPASLRPGTPVVEIDGDIAWVAGTAIAHRFGSAADAATHVRLDVLWEDVPMTERSG